MKRNLIVAAVAAVAVLALIATGGYVYFFSSLRTSPATLGLSATPSATATSPSSTSGLTGKWTIGSGSQVGYRVQELFAGENLKHLAVARTSSVSGSLTVAGEASSYKVSDITLTADLGSLHSVDQVAGRNVSQRDGIVTRQLAVQQFPSATFKATSTSVPGNVTSTQVDATAPGRLTIHGVTRDVTASAKAQVVGDKIEIAGTMTINMTDYGVSPPQAPFVTVDPTATIEFDLFLTRA